MIALSGGAVLGKGAKGVTIDVHSIVGSDVDTLYHRVMNASSISLYTSVGAAKPLVYGDAKSIQDFASVFINQMLVAKSFGREDDFNRELAVYERLAHVYGKAALRRYTAAASVKFKKLDVVAMKVVPATRLKSPVFYILNTKCSSALGSTKFESRYDVEQLILQVLASINTLQSMNYGHFDIKPDNIMQCAAGAGRSSAGRSNTLTRSRAVGFKLIDWDLAHELVYDKRFYASRSFTSPIAWKLSWKSVGNIGTLGQPQKMARIGTISGLAKKPYRDVFSHALMKGILEEVEQEHAALFQRYKTAGNQKLFDDYKYTIDLYSFGMTIMFVILQNGLEKECADIIDFAKLLLLSKIPDAGQALKLAASLMMKSKSKRSQKQPSLKNSNGPRKSVTGRDTDAKVPQISPRSV